MTTDQEKQQLRAAIRRLSAQLSPRYREAADRAAVSRRQPWKKREPLLIV